MSSPAPDSLTQRIRAGEEDAWRECIAEYEGRLQSFARRRLGDATLAEDIVQETFLGFLRALPNYDERTPLESFLFAIAAHKITDVLRRQGRRPVTALTDSSDGGGRSGQYARERPASSLARSREQADRDEQVLAVELAGLISAWRRRGEWTRLKCVELLLVRGLPNKEVAGMLQISEQDVANHKQYVVNRLKDAAHRAQTGIPEFR